MMFEFLDNQKKVAKQNNPKIKVKLDFTQTPRTLFWNEGFL